MELVPFSSYCYGDEFIVKQLRDRVELPVHGCLIISDADMSCSLLRSKLETCRRMYLLYRYHHDGILDDIMNLKSRKSKKAIYYFKRQVFAAVSSLHCFCSNPEECRSKLFSLISDEYRAGVGKPLSAKYMKAVSNLLKINITAADIRECAEGRDKKQIISLWNMEGNRVQRTDMYLHALISEISDEPGEEALLFYDDEFLETGSLPYYKKEYYLNLADSRE